MPTKPNLQVQVATTGSSFTEQNKRRIRECLRDYGVVTFQRLQKVAKGGDPVAISSFLLEEDYNVAGVLVALPNVQRANEQRAKRVREGFGKFCSPIPFPT